MVPSIVGAGNLRRWWRVTALLAVLVAASVLLRGARHDVYTQDTAAVIEGVHQVRACVGEGAWTACGFDPATRITTVSPYPLLQFVPAALLAGSGLGDDGVRTGLIWLNTAAVLVTVGLVAAWAKRVGSTGLAALAAGGLVTGMLTTYAAHSFGEPLAVLVITVLCLQCVARPGDRWAHAPAIFVSATLVAISKETAFVPAALSVIGLVLVAEIPSPVRRRRVLAAGAGLVAGVAVNTSFNVFRFGAATNLQYLYTTRPGPADAVLNGLSLMVAPNGGLVWFWFAAIVALVLPVLLLWGPSLSMSDVDPRSLRRQRRGALLVLAGFAAGMVSLAFWWMPFGWYAWGPRLSMPFVPPLIVLAVELARRGMTSSARAPSGPRRVAVVGLLAAAVLAGALMVPNLAHVWNRASWNSMQDATVADHPECGKLRGGPGPYAPFRRCLMESAWRLDGMPLATAFTEMDDAERPWFWLTALGAVCVWGAAVTLAARERGLVRPGEG